MEAVVSVVAGVPLEWHEGVELLADRPAPEGIPLARWRVFRFNAARLVESTGWPCKLRDGTAWTYSDCTGLRQPRTCPAWGVAWLLERGGVVLDVAPDATLLRLIWKRIVRNDRSVTWPLYRRLKARHTVARNMPNPLHTSRARTRGLIMR